MRADWEVFTHVPHSRDASPHGRDALTRAYAHKVRQGSVLIYWGLCERKDFSQKHGRGGKSRKGKGWAEPKPKEQIVDKCKFIRIILRNE